MLAKRIFQLVIHASLAVLCILVFAAVFFRHRADLSDAVFAVCALALGVALVASVRLNWLLLKNQRWVISVPPTSSLHFVLIVLGPALISLAGSLAFSYDDHLSFYNLYLKFPDWLWLPKAIGRFEIGIADSAEGIAMVCIWIFLFMLGVTLHTLALRPGDLMPSHCTIGRTLLYGQAATGAGILIIMLFLSYQFASRVSGFVRHVEFDPEILNTWNLGRMFFHFISAALPLAYAIWIIADSIYLLKRLQTGRLSGGGRF